MIAADAFPLDPCLWFATAGEPPATVPLKDSITTDILVIGAGYAGLSTALHLAELGHRPVVLEAMSIGFGASGRNGGQLVPGLKLDPDDIIAKFGREVGDRLVTFGGDTARTVFDLIEKYRMEVPLVREGWIQPAHSATGLKVAQRRVEQWARRGADVEFLNAAEVRERVGTDRYQGGWLDRRGGGVQPLSYVRELARAAQGLGVTIHTGTPVTNLARDGDDWVVSTSTGPTVRARQVVVCANAYGAGLWPGLSQTIIDANTYQVATEPLSAAVAGTILPHGQVASDTRNLLFYFRKDHTGRFIMGGRGPFREPTSQKDWGHLKRAALTMFPVLEGCRWEFYWCGRVAVTRDFLPHLHEPAPGLIIDIGCQGRGIGLQTSMGAALARRVHSGDASQLPVTSAPIRPLPLYALRRIYVSAVIAWYRFNDGL